MLEKLSTHPHSISNWWYCHPGISVQQEAYLLPCNEMGPALQLHNVLAMKHTYLLTPTSHHPMHRGCSILPRTCCQVHNPPVEQATSELTLSKHASSKFLAIHVASLLFSWTIHPFFTLYYCTLCCMCIRLIYSLHFISISFRSYDDMSFAFYEGTAARLDLRALFRRQSLLRVLKRPKDYLKYDRLDASFFCPSVNFPN